MDNNIINLCHTSSSSFSSTDENENVKVASTTHISNTPSRIVKVESSISRSAPVAMGKYKSREIKRENYVNESTRRKLFRSDDLDKLYESRHGMTQKKHKVSMPREASMPREFTMMIRKRLNQGLCWHLRCHAYWLRLNTTNTQSSEKKWWNANTLDQIASMIETQADETVLMREDGNYTHIPFVGKAFSKIIHAYFLAIQEEES